MGLGRSFPPGTVGGPVISQSVEVYRPIQNRILKGEIVNMKNLVMTAIVCILLVAASFASHASAAPYVATDIGTLGGATPTSSTANGINAAGQVVGESVAIVGDMYYTHAFFYDGTSGMADLGTLSPSVPFSSAANAVNDGGQVVGRSMNENYLTRAVLCADGMGMSDLGTLGGDYSLAFGINHAGKVVGVTADANGYPRALLHDGTTMHDLGVRAGCDSSEAHGINNAGHVVGSSSSIPGSVVYAFLYTETGGMSDIGSLGGDLTHAMAINDADAVVGNSVLSGGTRHAFLYTAAAGMTDLGILSTGGWSEAYDINNVGQIVGAASDIAGETHAFLYDVEVGAMVDLNTLADLPEGWVLTDATGINDNGWITATASNASLGQTHAFLLSPVPEPGTLALASSLLGLLAYAWRKRK